MSPVQAWHWAVGGCTFYCEWVRRDTHCRLPTFQPTAVQYSVLARRCEVSTQYLPSPVSSPASPHRYSGPAHPAPAPAPHRPVSTASHRISPFLHTHSVHRRWVNTSSPWHKIFLLSRQIFLMQWNLIFLTSSECSGDKNIFVHDDIKYFSIKLFNRF